MTVSANIWQARAAMCELLALSFRYPEDKVLAEARAAVAAATTHEGEGRRKKRKEKREAEALYAAFGAAYAKTEHWKLYLLSSHTEFERTFGRPADKKRKLYTGTLRCDLFQYTKDV